MQIKQIRELFDAGAIAGFEAYPAPMNAAGWLLVAQGREGGKRWTLETALGQPRVFSSLDTLSRLVTQIGVKVKRIEFW